MSTIQFEIPDEILISLKETPDRLSKELCLFGAIKLFEMGRLSSGRAAQLAGLSRIEFLNTIGQYQVSPFVTSIGELEKDVLNA
jgi:predicted HTH domain antitoxin